MTSSAGGGARSTPCPIVMLLAAFLMALAGCGGSGGSDPPTPPPSPPTIERAFDFSRGVEGWLAGYSDYSMGTAPTDVISEARGLPPPFSGLGYYAAGTNRSDDLFIYAKTRISGLTPLQNYRVGASVQFLTDVPSGCVGAGGAPGESVWVVVAASSTEPQTITNGQDYRLNIDRGNQGQSGAQGVVLGNIANSVPDCSARRWESKSLQTPAPSPLTARADERGELWFLVGFDSGFESFSQLYFQRVSVSLAPD